MGKDQAPPSKVGRTKLDWLALPEQKLDMSTNMTEMAEVKKILDSSTQLCFLQESLIQEIIKVIIKIVPNAYVRCPLCRSPPAPVSSVRWTRRSPVSWSKYGDEFPALPLPAYQSCSQEIKQVHSCENLSGGARSLAPPSSAPSPVHPAALSPAQAPSSPAQEPPTSGVLQSN